MAVSAELRGKARHVPLKRRDWTGCGSWQVHYRRAEAFEAAGEVLFLGATMDVAENISV